MSDITRGILEQTHIIFGSVKEVIMENMYELLGTFYTEIMAIVGDHTLSFHDFHACGAPEFFGEKDPISSKRWLVDIMNAFQIRFFPEGSKVRFASYPLKDRAREC